MPPNRAKRRSTPETRKHRVDSARECIIQNSAILNYESGGQKSVEIYSEGSSKEQSRGGYLKGAINHRRTFDPVAVGAIPGRGPGKRVPKQRELF